MVTKRNDERMNSHNRVMLENWRANVDLQVIVDENACARYMTKYAAKGEPRSKSASEILKLSVSSLRNDDQVSSAIKKTMIQVAGDRDMAAQETAHMLLSLPLVGCTYSFITICLENSRKVNLDAEAEAGDVLQKSVLQEYGERTTVKSRYTGLSQLNLMQYVSQYSKYRGELTKRTNPYIVRTFPKISSNPKGPDFERYCKYQLIKFKPWEGEPSNAWNNEAESNEMFINMYDYFLLTAENAEDHVIQYSKEKELLEIAQSGNISDSDDKTDESESEEDEPSDDEQVDDWMLLCRINQNYGDAGNPLSDNVNWFQDVRNVPLDLLKESPGWIYQQRKDAEELGQIQQYPVGDEQGVIDPESLNEQQRLAFDIITSQNGNDNEPVHMIVCRTAGTGKTFLIRAVKQVLGDQCIVTATTGIASFSINGQTLHSAAQLPIRECRDLQGDSLQRLQLRLEGKRFLIVDEMSMIGHKMLSWLDNRLRAGTGRQDIPFGGMSIILMGDFGQLPPVGDRPMYISGTGSVISDHGHSLYSGHGASAATSDEAGGLEAVLFISTRADVMLTCNLWAEVGLCNGSFGTIEQIWFAENMGPPNLPVAVLVHCPNYSGPAFLATCSKCIPVPPRLFEWVADGKHMSRQQVPLRLRYAMTIHKSQGQTLTKAVVDLGKAEKVAGCTFVATSRVRSIYDIVFEAMTFDRLKAIGRNKNLQKRLEAAQRLAALADKTVQKYSAV